MRPRSWTRLLGTPYVGDRTGRSPEREEIAGGGFKHKAENKLLDWAQTIVGYDRHRARTRFSLRRPSRSALPMDAHMETSKESPQLGPPAPSP